MNVAFDFVAALVGLKPSRRRDKIEPPRVQQTPAGIHLIFAGRCPNKRGQLLVINNNSSFIPFAGTHAGVITGSGDNITIYDPGGHYRANAGRGSDDTVRGPDVNVQDYINSQRNDGPDVVVHRYDTTPDQEAQILERIDSQGACFPGQCAYCTSGALQGIPPFQNLPTTWTPRGLNNALP